MEPTASAKARSVVRAQSVASDYTGLDDCHRTRRKAVGHLVSLRRTLFEAWSASLRSRADDSAIQRAADDLIGLKLLIEFIRCRTERETLSLQGLLTAKGRFSVRQLYVSAGKKVRSPLLRSVFSQNGLVSGLVVPKAVRTLSTLFETLSDACGMNRYRLPLSLFGWFHELCIDHGITRRASLSRHSFEKSQHRHANGVHYTPRLLADYVARRSLTRWSHRTQLQRSPRRVFDPCCGCGELVVAAVNVLLDQGGGRPGAGDPRTKRARHCTSAQERLDVLQRAVRGLDIDRRAVTWTKRVLLLAVWQSCIRDGVPICGIRRVRIPDMDKTIVCGNFLNPKGVAKTFLEEIGRTRVDVVLAAPPFVRIQQLYAKQHDCIVGYTRSFLTAQRGQFDLYMLFIEHALSVLSARGRLVAIVPRSFLRNDSARVARQLIARRCHIEEIVEFGSSGIYPDANVRVAALRADRGGESLRAGTYAMVSGPPEHLAHSLRRLEQRKRSRSVRFRRLGPSQLAEGRWQLAPVQDRRLMNQMAEAGVSLHATGVRIHLGTCTGADEVFIVKLRHPHRKGRILPCSTKSLGDVLLEADLLKPILRGREIAPYSAIAGTGAMCLFPYDRHARPYCATDLRRRHPLAWKYLSLHRGSLRRRRVPTSQPWYAFRRRMAANASAEPKLVASAISRPGGFAIDSRGMAVCHQSVLVISAFDTLVDPYLLMGILNSRVGRAYVECCMPRRNDSGYALRVGVMRQFPLVLPKTKQQRTVAARIHSRVRRLVHKTSTASLRETLKMEIDHLAGELYGT